MDHSDDELLISRQADDNVEQEETGTGSSKWRFLLTLCLVLVVYKGSEEMAKATVKQFVYSWCEENVHAHPRSDHSKSPAGYGNSSHHGTETNHSVCGLKEETAAQKLASRWELYLNLLNTILLYFSVAIFGTLSDYLGRKLFFCLALAGWAARCGIISVIIYFDFHIGWMMFAYSVDGLCGSHYVISMLTFASTADRTHEAHERVFGIAVMEAVLGVGKFTTQFGNGYFIKRYGYFYPMCTSTGGTVLAFAIALLCLKDTTSTTTSGANSHSSNSASFLDIPSIKTLFRNYIGFYSSKGDNHERLIFWICLVAFLFTEFGQEAKSDPLTLYQLGSPFCWSSEIIGWYNTAQILVALVVGCLGLKVLQKCFTDPVICCIGTVSAIAYCTVTGIARTTVWLFIGKFHYSFSK